MEGFEALQQMYREALPEKRAALDAEWQALLCSDTPEKHANALWRQLHQLAGSGGAYGYDAMGEMARELEKRWVQWLAQPGEVRPTAAVLGAELAPLMHALQQSLRAASLPIDDAL